MAASVCGHRVGRAEISEWWRVMHRLGDYDQPRVMIPAIESEPVLLAPTLSRGSRGQHAP